MPAIPPDERLLFLGPCGSCVRCRTDLLRHYCRSCDVFFFTCVCLSTIANTHLAEHRVYFWTRTGVLAIPDFDTFQLENQ